MSTLALSLPELREVEAAEREAEAKIARVGYGLAFSEAMFALIKVIFRLFLLSGALDTAVKGQLKLIGVLEHPAMNRLEENELLDLAERAEASATKTVTLVEKVSKAAFPPWKGYLKELSKQAEKLDSIAESFRMAADSQSRENIHILITSAETESKATNKQDWREFVASLHD